MGNAMTSGNEIETPTASAVPAPDDGAAESIAGWLPSIVAALLGAIIIAAVGFAPGIAHVAGHDVRHTMVYPCH